jgi:hypothetical protein
MKDTQLLHFKSKDENKKYDEKLIVVKKKNIECLKKN